MVHKSKQKSKDILNANFLKFLDVRLWIFITTIKANSLLIYILQVKGEDTAKLELNWQRKYTMFKHKIPERFLGRNMTMTRWVKQ